MKPEIKAVIIGNIFFIFVTLVTASSPINIIFSEVGISLTLLLTGLITCYHCRKNGWLYGLITVVLCYLEVFIFISSIIGYHLLEALMQNIPISYYVGDRSYNFIDYILLRVLIPGAIIGAFGGFLGEKLFSLKSYK